MTLIGVASGAGVGPVTIQSLAATMEYDSANAEVFDTSCSSHASNELPKNPTAQSVLAR